MIKLKHTYGIFITIMTLLPLQAAKHTEKTCNEKLILPDWITLPRSLHTFGQGKISESVFLKNKDYITLHTFKQHIKQAHKQNLPWIMVAHLWLSNEEGIARDYADATAFNNRHIDFTKEDYKMKKSQLHVKHHTPICLPAYYACTMDQTNQSQVEVTYLGSLNELQDKTSVLRILLEAVVSYEESAKAKLNLGAFYYKKGDKNKAQAYWKAAISKGDLDARVNFGMLCYKERNNNKAEVQWKIAASKGSIHAMVNLGTFYYYEDKDRAKAQTWWEMAATKGSVEAKFNLEILQKESI